MNDRPAGGRFPTTSWTRVRNAPHDPMALAELLEQYRPVIFHTFEFKIGNPHDADDLTQSFIDHLALSGDGLSRADSARGKFRSFLFRSMMNFLVDTLRKPKSGTPTDPADFDHLCTADTQTEYEYNSRFAAAILDVAINRVETSCRMNEMDKQWRVYEARDLLPKKYGGEPVSYDELKAELDVKTDQQLYTMRDTIINKLQRELKKVVLELVDDPAEAEEELRSLRGFLRG